MPFLVILGCLMGALIARNHSLQREPSAAWSPRLPTPPAAP